MACTWLLLVQGLYVTASSLHSGQTQQPLYDRSNYHANAGVLEYVNPLIGTYGHSPNDNGGMIPSVGLPFGMTRWTPQTRENFISQVPYSYGDRLIHGFQATHQPAIWMGEAGQTVLTPGMGEVQPLFENRGLAFRKEDERSTAYVYEVLLDATQLLDRNWNSTAEAVGDGPVPGGAGPVPEDVEEGAYGRKTAHVAEEPLFHNGPSSGKYHYDASSDEYSHSIRVRNTLKSAYSIERAMFNMSLGRYVFDCSRWSSPI
jgi:hypothetical protein